MTSSIHASEKITKRIRVGIGGWTYEPWRQTFYPADLPQKRELEFASRQVTAIEINGTYYRTQTPASFAKWRDETPDDFVFPVKASRYATNRKLLAEGGESIERFLDSGLSELRDKLGPLLWQFMPTKRFDAEDFEGFLELLPDKLNGGRLRHVLDVRHESFMTPQFLALAPLQGRNRLYRFARLSLVRGYSFGLRLCALDAMRVGHRDRLYEQGLGPVGQARHDLGGRWPAERPAACRRGKCCVPAARRVRVLHQRRQGEGAGRGAGVAGTPAEGLARDR